MVNCLSHGEIWKGSNAEIKVILYPKCYDPEKVDNIVVNLYTVSGTSIAFFGSALIVEGNEGYMVLQPEQLEIFEDGLLRYVVEYDYEEQHHVVECETRYFIKTPDDYTPIHIVTEENTQYFDKLVKKTDYLYDAEYSQLDYQYAKEYFKSKAPELIQGGCTSVRKDNFYGRNYDWLYSNQVEILVKTRDTMGVCGIQSITKDFIENNQKGLIYKLVPFYMQDGINSHGVFANINVVNIEPSKCTTIYSIPAAEKRDEICGLMLVRYILDNFNTATEAVEYIKNYISIYFPTALQDMGYECHYMIGDSEKTYALEIVNNQVVYQEADILSNFYLHGTSANTDGTYYSIIDTPERTPTVENGLAQYASGVERYNIAVLHEGTMRELMNSLMYTQTYTKTEGNDFWYSEYVGAGLGIDNTVEEYDANGRIGRIKQQFAERTRENPVTWQTVHSCVYDISGLTLELVTQENTDETFNYQLERGTSVSWEPLLTSGTTIAQISIDGTSQDVYAPDISGKAEQSALDEAISAFTAELDRKASTSAVNNAFQHEIERTETTYQKTLTAGSGITINNNVISATGGGSLSPRGSAIQPIFINSSGQTQTCAVGTSGNYRSFIPCVKSDGQMEIGAHLDFHTTDSTRDYDFRLHLNDDLDLVGRTYTGSVDDKYIVRGGDIKLIWTGTQAQYDALSTKDNNVLYFING